MITWLKLWYLRFLSWIQPKPVYKTVTVGSRDRSLPGKARIRARRGR